MPDAPAFIYDVKYAGKSCGEKVAAIRTELKKKRHLCFIFIQFWTK